MTSVKIPPLVTTISRELFSNATQLTKVTLPNTITSIGQNAFYSNSLKSIVIGDKLTVLDNYAFGNCNDLTEVTIKLTSPLSIAENVFPNRTNAILYVPKGCKQAYIAADYWKEFKEIIEMQLRGDVNNDGQTTSQDASLILQHLAGKTSIDKNALKVADMNDDGEVTAQDASLILQKVAGKIE